MDEKWKRPPVTTGKKAFTKEEIELIRNAVVSLEDELLIQLAVTTGIRRADITALMIRDFDPEEGSLEYYEQKKNRRRKIYLDEETSKRMAIYIGVVSGRQDKMFKFSDRTAYNRLKKLCLVAGVPPRPFHALRATCIKFCQAAGWTAEQVAEHVGDSIRVIQEHYSTPSDAEMKEVVRRKPIL